MQGTEYTTWEGDPDQEIGPGNPLKHYLVSWAPSRPPQLSFLSRGRFGSTWLFPSFLETLFLSPGSARRTPGSDRVQEVDFMFLLNR